MKDLLEMIVKNIVLHPDDVLIEEELQGDFTVYSITVNQEDMGRIIGKSGKVIKAIRSIAHIVSIRHGAQYRIKVTEVNEENQSEEAVPAESESVEETVQVQDEETIYEQEKKEETDDLLVEALSE